MTMKTYRHRLAATVAAVALLLAGACGDDDASSEALPPVEVSELVPLYEDELADLGMRLTERGGLIDLGDGGYEQSEDGTHLALYAVPIGDRTEDEYVQGITELTALFAVDVFERWPGLESFDVCQEPPGGIGRDGPYGEGTVTQVNLTREAAASIDWETVTLVDLFVAALEDEDSDVRAFGTLRSDPAIQAAAEEARARTGTSPGWGS